jgi:hypothetical protein
MDQSVMDRQSSDSNPNTSERPHGKRTSYILVTVLLLIFAAAAVIGLLLRASERRALAKETESLAVPTVVVVHPKLEAPQQELVLPSTLQAFTGTKISEAGYKRENCSPRLRLPKSIRNFCRRGQPRIKLRTK